MPEDSLLLAADSEVVRMALDGLSATPKTLPPQLLYDPAGCELFYRITRLPEYYLTRTEMALLPSVAADLVHQVRPPSVLVEYGASDETKARVLLGALEPGGRAIFAAYVPVDIAAEAMGGITHRLRGAGFPHVYPVVTDFTQPLTLPRVVSDLARFGFFPGSTIGNLDPDDARRFLAQARATLGPDSLLLVGADLRKDAAPLVAAYDDAAGVTAAFNRNLLVRLNREAEADFDVAAFAHRAVWNAAAGRIEMHLVSLRDQTVRVAGRAIRFARDEFIHTENSYKYTEAGFARLAQSAGWRASRCWTDPERLFSIHLLCANS